MENQSESDEEFEPSVNDQYLFPDDFALFCDYVGKYLLLAAANLKSSYRKRDKIAVATLSGRRNDMFFWSREKLTKEVQQPRWAFQRDTEKAYTHAA